MSSRPSAPIFWKLRLFSSMVCVLFEPLPAITGTRPATRSTTNLHTSSSSSCDMVDDSPVVPNVSRASVPFSKWKSTRRPSAPKSTLPSSANGVTSATMEPLKPFMSAMFFPFVVSTNDEVLDAARPPGASSSPLCAYRRASKHARPRGGTLQNTGRPLADLRWSDSAYFRFNFSASYGAFCSSSSQPYSVAK